MLGALLPNIHPINGAPIPDRELAKLVEKLIIGGNKVFVNSPYQALIYTRTNAKTDKNYKQTSILCILIMTLLIDYQYNKL